MSTLNSRSAVHRSVTVPASPRHPSIASPAPASVLPAHFSLTPVRFRNLVEQIAATLRLAIADGKLRPGTRLLEVQIAREMGTSRAPLREALLQLEREGLVVRQPNRGTFVADLNEEMVREVASLRGVLEGFAASLAVRHLTRADFDRLEAILREMLAVARQGDFPRMIEWDYQFHEHIMRASRHRLLYETWVGMDRKIRVYLSATNLMYGDMKAVVQGHVPILRALERRDPERARRVMAEHLDEVLDLFITKVLRSDGRGQLRTHSSQRASATPPDAEPIAPGPSGRRKRLQEGRRP
jgi:DNA-binding GntR family transcriptional regulator